MLLSTQFLVSGNPDIFNYSIIVIKVARVQSEAGVKMGARASRAPFFKKPQEQSVRGAFYVCVLHGNPSPPKKTAYPTFPRLGDP
jgi:hypothetical protein